MGAALQADGETRCPKGRNVVLDKSFGAPRITKDGVTVAKEIELEDKFENMGAQMVRECIQKMVLAQGVGHADREAPRDEEGDRGVATSRFERGNPVVVSLGNQLNASSTYASAR